MKQTSLYAPFEHFTFDENRCFLSGEILETPRFLPAFPEWIMDRYQLHDKSITMLAENVVTYKDLKVPCSEEVAESIINLERKIEDAFSIGYDAVKELPQLTLFQWMARIQYGVLYNDIRHGIAHQRGKEKPFSLSELLKRKYANLHFMLQSLIWPLNFDLEPWSIYICRVNYSKDVFNYRDETKNVNFSLGMNGFGMLACLQDNGENNVYHQSTLHKIGTAVLHPIQFEELCARYLYSNYLLQDWFDYSFTDTNPIQVTSERLEPENEEPLFRNWEDKTYSQVLANYWAPWGFTSKDIYTFPDSPISYLIDEYANELIDPASITLPN